MERTPTIGSVITEVINMDDDKDLRAWADKFDGTKAKLKAAVNAVGNSQRMWNPISKRIAGSNLQHLSHFILNL